MKIFLDTDVVLDYFSGRMHDGVAERLIQIGLTPEYEMCISVLTAANTMYVASRHYKTLRPDDLMKLFRILPMDAVQWNNACQLQNCDFEDSLQIACATDAQCNVIITRNGRHYEKSIIRTYSPSEFVEKIPVEIQRQ